MMKTIDEISVFLPAYNEEENIKSTILHVKEVLEEVAEKWEIIVINDGSKDKTGIIIDDLEKSDKRIKVVNHIQNLGYGASLASGFYASKYNWIAFIDSDGQFDFKEITKFIDKQKETQADLVIGYYKKRKESFTKVLTSKIWEAFIFTLFGLKVRDIDCAFKLVSKKVIDTIPRLESERGAFISSELLIKAKKKGFKIAEVSVNHYPRLRGKGTGRNLNVIIKSFIDLFKLWKKIK